MPSLFFKFFIKNLSSSSPKIFYSMEKGKKISHLYISQLSFPIFTNINYLSCHILNVPFSYSGK